MTQTIDELNPASSAALTDVFEISKAGVSQSLTAQQIADLIGFKTVYKTADQTINNQTAFVNDADLRFAVETFGIYAIKAHIILNTGTIPDYKDQLSLPAGTTGFTEGQGDFKVAFPSGSEVAIDVNTVRNHFVSITANFHFQLDAVFKVGSTPGNFIYSWSQNTNDAQDTILRELSYIMYRKLN